MIGPKIKNVTNINSKRYLPIASLSFGVLSFSFPPKSYPIAQQAAQYNIKNIIKIIKSAITAVSLIIIAPAYLVAQQKEARKI